MPTIHAIIVCMNHNSYMPVSPGQSRDLGFCPGSKGNSENVPGFFMHFVYLHGM